MFDKIVDKLIKFKYFNVMFWCILLPFMYYVAYFIASGLYDIIKEMIK